MRQAWCWGTNDELERLDDLGDTIPKALIYSGWWQHEQGRWDEVRYYYVTTDENGDRHYRRETDSPPPPPPWPDALLDVKPEPKARTAKLTMGPKMVAQWHSHLDIPREFPITHTHRIGWDIDGTPPYTHTHHEGRVLIVLERPTE